VSEEEARMETIKTDLCIIGAGPGGYVAAIYAKKQGLDVVLIDKEWIGGTCLNVGCIPTKSLVRSAELYHTLKTEALGIDYQDLTIDLDKVIDRKDTVKDQLISGIAFLLKKHDITYIEGHASFQSESEVIVNDQLIQAKDYIIATGARPKRLPIEGKEYVLTSRDMMQQRDLPESMVVIGGGIIGMEFAFIYAQMGVKVDVIEFLPRILPGIDKELAMRLIPYAKKAGINVHTNAKVVKVEEKDSIKTVFYDHKDKEKQIETDLVLEAVGRQPVVEGFGLDKTKLTYSPQGIQVDDYMRTNVDHIYAIGDVNNIMQLAHVASHQAMVAVDHILGKAKPFSIINVPSVIFTSPTIATVGITEEMAKEKGIEVDVVKVPYSANGKAMILSGERGYIKVIRDQKSKELIGAMVMGKEAENLIASYTLAINNHLKSDDVYHTIYAHPTIQELVHESALGLDQLAIHFIE